jgi:DoxX-like family
MPKPSNILYAVIALPMAAFFAFVGYHKVFSSMADLARYGAYTAHLPEWIGRIAGLGEIASAAAILAGINPKWRKALPMACGFVILSQIVSSIIHIQHDELAALRQNGVIAVVALVMIWLGRRGKERGGLKVG